MSTKYRAGIIGATGRGNYGHGLDTAWQNQPDVTVIAVADPDPAGREQAQARSGAARAYPDYQDMLEKEKPDLVSIGPRWPDQHESMALAAIGAGARGLFIEKPFTHTLAEADRVLAAAKRSGTKIQLAHHHHAMAVVHAFEEIVRGGELGEVREVFCRPTDGPRGGAFLYEALGTHVLDTMRHLVGDPAWVIGRVTTRDGREVTAADAVQGNEAYGFLAGDAVSALFGFPRGVTGHCDSFWAPTVPGASMYVEVWGTEGVVALRDGPSRIRELFRATVKSGRPIQELEKVPVPGWDDDPRTLMDGFKMGFLNDYLARDLLDAIEHDREPVASGEDGRWTLEMIHGLHESHLTGCRVALPMSQRENPYAARR